MPYRPIPELAIEQRGPIAIVTLNNPDMRNAFSDDMHEGMREECVDLGLANFAVPDDELMGRATELAAVDGAMVGRATA